MAIELKNLLTGGMLGFAGLFTVLINISVLHILFSKGFTKRSNSFAGVYILASGAIIGDTLQQMLTVIYVAPGSIMQSFIVTQDDRNHPVVQLFAYLFLFLWYQGVIFQAVIALDRCVSIVFKRKAFSHSTYIKFVLVIFGISGTMAVGSQFVSPCCTCYIYYATFGYAYLGDTFNYSDHYVDLPLNTSTTVIMGACYFWIFANLRRTRMITIQKEGEKSQKRRDVRFAAQFGVIAAVLAFTWISFRIFPLIIPPEIPQLYSLITMALVFHCSSTALVFVTMNKQFRRAYIITYFGQKYVSDEATIFSTTRRSSQANTKS